MLDSIRAGSPSTRFRMLESCMIRPENIVSLSEFQRDAAGFLKRLKRSGDAYVLTVRGRAAVCVVDALRYERLLVQMRRQEDREAIRDGLEQADAGKTVPWDNVRKELARRVRARRTGAARRRKAG